MSLVKQQPNITHNEGGLTRWNPWDEFGSIRSRMDDLFNRSFGLTPFSSMSMGTFEPPVDIYTTDEMVTVYCSLPGYQSHDVNVETTSDLITITGERKSITNIDKAVAERSSGTLGESRFRVQCTLPCEVNPNKVKATFRDGILHIEMQKSEQARVKAVRVPIMS